MPALVSAAMPGVGVLLFSAYMWQLTGRPLIWAELHLAWGRDIRGCSRCSRSTTATSKRPGCIPSRACCRSKMLNALGAAFVLPRRTRCGAASDCLRRLHPHQHHHATRRRRDPLGRPFLGRAVSGIHLVRSDGAGPTSLRLDRRVHGRAGARRHPLLYLARDVLRRGPSGTEPDLRSYNCRMPRKALGLAAALVSLVSSCRSRLRKRGAPRSRRFNRPSGRSSKGATTRSPAWWRRWTRRIRTLPRAARAPIARGKYPEAEASCGRLPQRAPASEAGARTRAAAQMLRRPEATAILTRVAATADGATDPHELARARRALRALGRAQEAERRLSRCGGTRAARRRHPDRLGRSVPREVQARRSAEVVSGCAEGGSAIRAGAARRRPRARRRESAGGDQAREAGAGNQPVGRRRPRVHRRGSRRRGQRDEARKSLQKALAVNPSSLEAHALLAALAYVEDKKAEFDAEVAKVLAIAPNYGEVYRVAGETGGAQLPLRRGGRAHARGALTLEPDERTRPRPISGMHLLRTGDETEARRALEASFKRDPFDLVTYNLLQMLDTLDKFVTVTRRRHHPEAGQGRGAGPARVRDAAGARGARDAVGKRYEFTPKGPILIEMFPKHDDFAVRNVGLPGMIGALGACFGRVVTMDSPQARAAGRVPVGGDAVARAGARHHAADVEPARAALADRRHLGLRGDARAARVGPRDGRAVRAAC